MPSHEDFDAAAQSKRGRWIRKTLRLPIFLAAIQYMPSLRDCNWPRIPLDAATALSFARLFTVRFYQFYGSFESFGMLLYSPSAGEESENLRPRVPQILIFKCRQIYTTTG
jgi:hypothetical protein